MLPCPPPRTCQYLEGLTESAWKELKNQGLTKEESQTEVYQRIYYGGVEQTIRYSFIPHIIRIISDLCNRREVWQYLLGHLDWGDSVEDTQKKERYDFGLNYTWVFELFQFNIFTLSQINIYKLSKEIL